MIMIMIDKKTHVPTGAVRKERRTKRREDLMK